MTTIKLYWNNICVLHRQELQFLNEIREELRKDNIDLDITCFGLGYGRHMSDYLREEDSVLPDLVVSTDLEVFEDERIWNRFREHGLLPLKEFFPVKDIPELGGLKKASALLPYLAIPLVFYSDVELLRQTSMDASSINANFFTGTDADSEQSISLNRLVESSFPLSYGGINNSAVKTVAKLTWESFGMKQQNIFLLHQMFSTCRSRPFIRFPSVRHLSPWFRPSMRSGLTAKKIRPIGLWKALRQSPPISVRAPRSRKMPFSPL